MALALFREQGLAPSSSAPNTMSVAVLPPNRKLPSPSATVTNEHYVSSGKGKAGERGANPYRLRAYSTPAYHSYRE